MPIETVRKLHDDKSDFLITCDEKGCSASVDAMDRTWKQMIRFLDALGWYRVKHFGTWMQFCPECNRKSRALASKLFGKEQNP
jgi:hypothetical protein